ncbi:glycosyltransferase [Rhodobacteraceae bacterium RKSG542]|uniref:sugar transferase n=1 Tax=Pseudovibrio flavus TaxID=2529854 RepID=UPI0012BCD3F1|nr:sugar transferase [Pseudovibrio flavus]MTI18892.1 glycosyltransferase [Pseudovibrio flavus]
MAAEFFAVTSGALLGYHGLVYPWLLRYLSANKERVTSSAVALTAEEAPSIEIIIPAYNEAEDIAAKLENLAALDYPREKLQVTVVFDGCTDDTFEHAEEVLKRKEFKDEPIRLDQRFWNRGKVAVLNEAVGSSTADIILLTDVSAMIKSDALLRIVERFDKPEVGVVCGTYKLESGDAGETSYWSYQTWVKDAEGALASPFGAHGALYAFRTRLWEELPENTINDDVIIPMRIVEQGYKAVYDLEIVATEREKAARETDLKRRIRIGAGNLQQAMWLWRLADPRNPEMAFIFLSGKGLRAFVPALLFIFIIACLFLAFQGSLLGLLVVLLVVASLGVNCLEAYTEKPLPSFLKPFSAAGYAIGGQAASLLGICSLIAGRKGPWRRAADNTGEPDYIHPLSRAGKRVLDVFFGTCAFIVMAIIYVPLAIIIKLDSPGPIFYRQYRVGERTPDQTKLFLLTKFRTMRTDAEKDGAQWAKKNDPRATRFGRFMRKTRIDELPQCLNVLRGEMSVVGPRPERPAFFEKLEDEIPFYIERTYGLRPGITGLAQVEQGYDEDIEDVRSKVMHDHVYAMRLVKPLDWLKTDLSIIFRTVTVMATGRGR